MKAELIVQVSSRSQSWVHVCQGRPPGTHPRSAGITFAMAKTSGISHSLFMASDVGKAYMGKFTWRSALVTSISVIDTPNRDSLS